ncbi:MAG: peptide deformylase [Bacteroidales bacterium]|nr:peptide deformylase [Bacteroidales bacterium]
MVYPIHILGCPVLRKVAQDIDPSYPNLQQLVADLYETLAATDGVGLAAPQVGISVRVFVVDAAPFADDEPALASFRRVFINAHIEERMGTKEYFNEGCLSIPGVHEDVLREPKIRMRFVDEQFQPHVEEFGGIAARIIQHEYDHLDGKLFIDHVSPLRRQLLKSKLSSIQRGRFEASYRYKMAR